jgi:hypothetical protein
MPEQRRVPLDEKGLPVRKSDVAPESADDVRAALEAALDSCECPELDHADWDGVESDWSDIAFLATTTSAVLGVPMGFDSARDDLRRKAKKLGATVPDDAMLLNGAGKFRRPMMLEVEVAGAAGKDVVRPGGVAYTRIYEAPWGQLKKFASELEREATERYGRKPDDVWVWYLTCRHCSKRRNFETLILAHYRDAPA